MTKLVHMLREFGDYADVVKALRKHDQTYLRHERFVRLKQDIINAVGDEPRYIRKLMKHAGQSYDLNITPQRNLGFFLVCLGQSYTELYGFNENNVKIFIKICEESDLNRLAALARGYQDSINIFSEKFHSKEISQNSDSVKMTEPCCLPFFPTHGTTTTPTDDEIMDLPRQVIVSLNSKTQAKLRDLERIDEEAAKEVFAVVTYQLEELTNTVEFMIEKKHNKVTHEAREKEREAAMKAVNDYKKQMEEEKRKKDAARAGALRLRDALTEFSDPTEGENMEG